MDQTKTFLEILNPKDCKTALAIPTGIIATLGPDRYPDAVCSSPGCWYDSASQQCQTK
jgi:hypothetical protein